MRGQKAIVPKNFRSMYIEILRESHLGADRTERLAGGVLYGLYVRLDIDEAVSQCQGCKNFNTHFFETASH